MSSVHEYTCGCMHHEMAGFIRRCSGQTSRSLSGRIVRQGDGNESRHNSAMGEKAVRVYSVASIVP